jgi:RimJ/RimL family protein N-acetyltransferase
VIETERLILRPFRDEDREAFAAINGDPRVGDWLGGVRTRAESDQTIDRINAGIAERGYDFWAAARRSDDRLVGMIGLRPFDPSPPGPCIEMGWRLSPDAQGQGLATEGAKAALAWGFANLDVAEIIAFTAYNNLSSQAVMTRLGMVRDPARDFLHPNLAPDHPLRPHVVFVAKREA